MYSANEGETIACSQEFLTEEGIPASLRVGYPKARLMYLGQIVSELHPEIGTSAGTWTVNATIPEMGFVEPTPIELKWRAFDTQGNLYKITDLILVRPFEHPEVGDVIIMEDETVIEASVPTKIDPAVMTTYVTLYQDNDIVTRTSLDPTNIFPYTTYTTLAIPKPLLVQAQLKPYLLLVETQHNTLKREKQKQMLNVWVVTPQILNCMNALENFLNKAKIDNVIPQLEYTQIDLLSYLQRGLNLFNSYYPNLTNFTGTNMQGALFDCLLMCASYYALGAQLLAEGMLSFDFSGQAVNLNVDRTPQLEAALGRVEAQLQDRIPRVKQMLLRRGVVGGTGSDPVGSSLGIGLTVLSNSPTTSKNIFRPGFNQYYR